MECLRERCNALDTLVVIVHSVKMRVGFGYGIKTKGRPLSVMAHLKKSIAEVKTEENCLAHALIIAIAKVDNDANYKSYRQCRKIRSVVQTLLQETGIDLNNGAVFSELNRFEEHFRDYKIVAYQGLGCYDNVRRPGRRFQTYQLTLRRCPKTLSCDHKSSGCHGKKVHL